MPGPRQILQVEHFMVTAVMVIRQAYEGDRQPHACHNRQKDHGERQRRVGLPQMQLNGVATPGMECRKLAVAQTKSDCRKAKADQGSGRNNRSAKCSHRSPSASNPDLKAHSTSGPVGRIVNVYMLNILRQPPKSSSIPAIMMKKVLQPHPGQAP
jgi:hypothetical protein